MREIGSLLEMAVVFGGAVVEVPLELHHALTRVAVEIETTAKGELGTYQPAVGPFSAWAELSESTKQDRLVNGFSENDPLLRTGQMRDDITHDVEGLEAMIGTPESAQTADIATYQEFGTSKMPARPFLGPAAFRSKRKIERLVGAGLVSAIIGGGPVHESLGYDFETKD